MIWFIEFKIQRLVGKDDRKISGMDKNCYKVFLNKTKYLFIGIICIIITFTISLNKEQNFSPRIVVMGDSIVANYEENNTGVVNYLEGILEEDVFNAAFGGSSVVNNNLNRYETQGEDSLSFEKLVDGILSKDFTPQYAAVNKINAPKGYAERLYALATINFAELDYLVLEGGINDFALQSKIDDFYRVYKDKVSKIQKEYPNLKIIMVSLSYSYLKYNDDIIYCEDDKFYTYTLSEYVEKMRLIAKELEIDFVDRYNTIITKDNINQYSLDGIHLNEAGRKLLAQEIAEKILKDYK